MGIQKNIRAKGSFGNAVFYELNGKGIIRSKPVQIKQTKATKASAGLFGKATRLGKLLRQAWKPHLHIKGQRELQYRLDRALMACLQENNWNSLVGFELNTDISLSSHWNTILKIEGDDQNCISLTALPTIKPLLQTKTVLNNIS